MPAPRSGPCQVCHATCVHARRVRLHVRPQLSGCRWRPATLLLSGCCSAGSTGTGGQQRAGNSEPRCAGPGQGRPRGSLRLRRVGRDGRDLRARGSSDGRGCQPGPEPEPRPPGQGHRRRSSGAQCRRPHARLGCSVSRSQTEAPVTPQRCRASPIPQWLAPLPCRCQLERALDQLAKIGTCWGTACPARTSPGQYVDTRRRVNHGRRRRPRARPHGPGQGHRSSGRPWRAR
jgi:hypothetical protein